MKERIISSLRDIADRGSDTEMGKQLLPLLDITSELLQQRASTLLSNILHNYSDLSVSTIDSFVHRIIRSFAYDLHLPSNFEIEMDAEELLSMAVEKLLENVKEEEASQITKALIDFAENNLSEGRGWHLEWVIDQFCQRAFQ